MQLEAWQEKAAPQQAVGLGQAAGAELTWLCCAHDGWAAGALRVRRLEGLRGWM